jgi:hypothetical protein
MLEKLENAKMAEMLATQSIKARARHKGRASLYDW